MSKIRIALDRIYNDRKELGQITQDKIAEYLGCAQPTVSQYLSGRSSMSAEVIEGFCEVLGVTLAELQSWNPQLASKTDWGEEPIELRVAIADIKNLYGTNKHAFQSVARTAQDWLEAVDQRQQSTPTQKTAMG